MSITTQIPSINWPDRKIWKTIPPSNVAESNWASVAGLVPIVELKIFRTPQQVVIYSMCGNETDDVRDSTPKKDAKNEMHKFFIQ
jgi:hypothetical protein